MVVDAAIIIIIIIINNLRFLLLRVSTANFPVLVAFSIFFRLEALLPLSLPFILVTRSLLPIPSVAPPGLQSLHGAAIGVLPFDGHIHPNWFFMTSSIATKFQYINSL
jgi:hypothetical protein